MAYSNNGSSKFQGYVKELIHKIHEVEELLLAGDDRHLEELKEVSDMIDQYVNEAQGHKFEPAKYRNVQVGQPQPGQPSSNYYPEYPRDTRQGDIKGHIGYYPYTYPIYPLYSERGGNGRNEGYSPDYYDRRRR